MNTSTPTFTNQVRVYYEDTDAGGIVYHSNYLKYYERGRSDFLRQLGLNQRTLLDEHGLAFVVHTLHINYMRGAGLDDWLTVVTNLVQITGSRLVFDQHVLLEDTSINRANVQVAVIDYHNKRPRRLPKFLQQLLSPVVHNA